MKLALDEASEAYKQDEVPIGAVIVRNGIVISKAHNLREVLKDPTAHAEILAIKKASETLDAWRLLDCDLYVTIEPCPMCAGAIVQARIKRLIFGAKDPKAGACGSVMDVIGNTKLNHKVEVTSGIMESECSNIMKDYFKRKRI
ncbi:tRNA-specific adenosine deaminase [Oxobacter pfennigii]|uniref:tRNA-specific adenosine deaminase n=1 Tax=Oxobacter pfennigii TaxID=36849 RepID=A0A0P8WT18_9CLOT|nr:tRNA-specific adenosine deaminase [Oxobacter pfennigii]